MIVSNNGTFSKGFIDVLYSAFKEDLIKDRDIVIVKTTSGFVAFYKSDGRIKVECNYD